MYLAGLENFETENAVTTERYKYKMLRHIRMTPSIHSVQAEEGNQVMYNLQWPEYIYLSLNACFSLAFYLSM